MKRLNTKYLDRRKSALNASPESRMLKFIKTGDFSTKSQKSLEVIKEIFGSSNHAECRNLM